MRKVVSTLDALRTFYVADELLEDVIKTAGKDEKKLRRGLARAVARAKRTPTHKIIAWATRQWAPRFDNYFNSRWALTRVPLSECGVFPRMGGLPDAATRGTVLDTAEYVRMHIKRKKRSGRQLARAIALDKRGKFAEIITEYVPIIVFEDGIIRHANWKRELQRARYVRCTYDIDDGNHRAVFMALREVTDAPALVGKRICKNPLLYS